MFAETLGKGKGQIRPAQAGQTAASGPDARYTSSALFGKGHPNLFFHIFNGISPVQAGTIDHRLPIDHDIFFFFLGWLKVFNLSSKVAVWASLNSPFLYNMGGNKDQRSIFSTSSVWRWNRNPIKGIFPTERIPIFCLVFTSLSSPPMTIVSRLLRSTWVSTSRVFIIGYLDKTTLTLSWPPHSHWKKLPRDELSY